MYKYYATCIFNLSKQLTINKCTLLDCTNTEILMHYIYIPKVHKFGIPYTQTDTHDVSAPWKIPKEKMVRLDTATG